MKIEQIEISKLKPYDRNAKIHTTQQIEQIKKSIEQFGMNDPIAVWGKDNLIIEGHGRLEALKQLGYEVVDCIRLDHLTDDERKAYTLAHNKLTMNTDFDIDILNDELNTINGIDMLDFGFEFDSEIDDKDIEEDDYNIDENIPEQAKSKSGQIYKLGNHILMCGDSTSVKDVEKLMGGEIADLLFTDPPYNVNVSNSQGMTIENDNMSDTAFREFLSNAFQCASASLKSGGAFYIWHADSETINFRETAKENGLTTRQCLIWVKNGINFGRQDYKWKHEPCLYGWKDGSSHYFVEEYNHPTVIEDGLDIRSMKKEELISLVKELLKEETAQTIIHEDKPVKNELHPTMKPLRLCGQLIRNSTKPKEIVLDLFGGSGSTLMVCEQLNRVCYMMEYDPKYVDVIIDRWEKFSGRKAELVNG